MSQKALWPFFIWVEVVRFVSTYMDSVRLRNGNYE